ncbi:MAG: MmgE/PrpD family protein [Acutalibacteraceae bacterium]
MSISRELTRLAMGITKEKITRATIEYTEKVLIDTIGCLIAGHAEPGVHEVRSVIEKLGSSGDTHILVYGDKARIDDAVMLNSIMIHAMDYDDIHTPAVLHIMSKLVPTTLAVGEMCGASGMDVLEAIIAGVEIGGRIGRKFKSFGFLNSNIAGGFGVVAAACKLLGLDEDQTVNAFGIYHSQNCGNRQALLEGALCKRIQPAFAAKSAVLSSLLAKEGFTGPENVFEGTCGVFNLYSDGDYVPDVKDFTAEKPYFEIEHDALKSYPTCGAHHSAIRSAELLKEEYGFTAEDIEKVELFLMNNKKLVGNPFVLGSHPQVNAQFSAQYAVALALVHGKAALKYFKEDRIISDTKVTRLAQNIIVPDKFDRPVPKEYAEREEDARIVRVYLKDGRVLEKGLPVVKFVLPEAMSLEDVYNKFYECAEYSGICSKEKAESIIESVHNLKNAPSIKQFIQDNLILM